MAVDYDEVGRRVMARLLNLMSDVQVPVGTDPIMHVIMRRPTGPAAAA